MTRSAYVQVRCAVVALWSEHHPRYAHRIRPASTKLDSILPTLPVGLDAPKTHAVLTLDAIDAQIATLEAELGVRASVEEESGMDD
jgi:hypothetical protein